MVVYTIRTKITGWKDVFSGIRYYKSCNAVHDLSCILDRSSPVNILNLHALKNCFGSVFRVAPVRFGSVTVWGWNGSSSSGFRFRLFLCDKGFSVFQHSLTGKDGSPFGSWKTVPAVPVPLSVSGKMVPTAAVSGSGSLPEPTVDFFSCNGLHDRKNCFGNLFGKHFGADGTWLSQTRPQQGCDHWCQ